MGMRGRDVAGSDTCGHCYLRVLGSGSDIRLGYTMKIVNCGYIYDTNKADDCWDEQTEFDGSNHISLATGSQWNHERLFVTGNQRYFVWWWSAWQGATDKLFPLTHNEAAEWLIRNQYDLPDHLADVLKEA